MAGGENFGARIKRLRQREQLTQEAFAARIGVRHPTISRWENSGRYPLRKSILKITAAFGMTEEELMYAPIEAPPLSPMEEHVLEIFRNMPEDKRTHWVSLGAAVAQRAGKLDRSA